MLTIPSSTKLVLVVKGQSIQDIQQALNDYSVYAIGESRWQEAKVRLDQFFNIRKHFIGHLQTNKAADIVKHFDCIESVNSIHVAQAINLAAEKSNKIQEVFLQINVSKDPHKFGFLVDEVAEQLVYIEEHFSYLQVRGLMTITAHQDSAKTKHDFELMKQLQIQLALPELSMGMSNDWKLAIESGATIIRIGRALFEKNK